MPDCSCGQSAGHRSGPRLTPAEMDAMDGLFPEPRRFPLPPAPRPPRRVRVQGDLYHGVIPVADDGLPAVYVGRAAPGLKASPYANPFKVGETVMRDSELWPWVAARLPLGALADEGPMRLAGLTITRAEDAVAAYSAWFFDVPALLLSAREELGGRDLACWCKLPKADGPDHCHAAWLLGMVAELEADDA